MSSVAFTNLAADPGVLSELLRTFAGGHVGSVFQIHGWTDSNRGPGQTVEFDEVQRNPRRRTPAARITAKFDVPWIRACDADRRYAAFELADLMRSAVEVKFDYEPRPDPPAALSALRDMQDAFHLALAESLSMPLTAVAADPAFSAAEIQMATDEFIDQWARWGLTPAPRELTPDERAELERTREAATARSIELLRDWLTPEQRADFDETKSFEVVGGCSGRRYRVKWGYMMNVDEEDGGAICFAPIGAGSEIPVGDVMLAQKIALETDESEALRIANRRPPPPAVTVNVNVDQVVDGAIRRVHGAARAALDAVSPRRRRGRRAA